MATAQKEGGLYYTDKGQPVDAEGQPVKGAPKIGADTDPSKQPGAAGAVANDPIQRLADTITSALTGKAPASAKTAPADDDELDETDSDEGQAYTLEQLPGHLATLTTVEDVRAARKGDKRKGAKPLYEARIAELEAE